ncbi:hypothetical protein [Caminibacter sp.]
MCFCKCDTLKEVSDKMFDDEEKFLCDFDTLKKEYCENNRCQSLSSCDGLFIKDNEFFFLEFKDLKKIKKNKDIKNFVKKHIQNKDSFLRKIDESKHILDFYIYKIDRDMKFNSKFFYYVVITWPIVSFSENFYLKMKMLSVKPTKIEKEIESLKTKIKDKVEEISKKVYFLEDCDYLEKEEFISKSLFWNSKECKGE